MHRQVIENLELSGVLILETCTPEQLRYGTGGPSRAEMMMDAAVLREERGGPDFQWLSERKREGIEGRYHRGRGHVVQAVARKPG